MLSYSVLNFKDKLMSNYLNEDVFNLLDQTFIIPKNFIYNVFEVTKEYIARPDLISYDAYGDTIFTDVICKLNGISNPFELNEGMKLIIPSPENIMDFVIRPNQKENENNFYNNFNLAADGAVPVAKLKQSKRQANEAVVGDSRFKIDSATGIIIY